MKEMRKTFKKYFIPHEENNHRPHFLREETVANILSLILLFEVAFFAYAFLIIPNSSYLAAILSTVLIDLTNENRAENSVGTLKVNPILEQAATRKAEDMARLGYFSHNGPDGKAPWEWFRESGYAYRYAGENLAVNFIDSGDVVTAWMNSTGHRKNILDSRFTEIGIGTAKGFYKGRETIFIVQFFGKPILENAESLASAGSNPFAAAAISGETPPPITKPTPTSQPAPVSKTVPEKKSIANRIPQSGIARQETTDTKILPVELVPEPAQKLKITPADASILAKIGTSPSAASGQVFMVLIGAATLSLLFSFGGSFHVPHPRLILNGSLVIAVLLGFLILNRYIALANIGI